MLHYQEPSQSGVLERAKATLNSQIPLILTGPSGCGKTTLVQDLARERGQTVELIVGSPDLTLHDLIGSYILKGGESEFIEGPVLRAMCQPALLYLDEIDAFPAGLLKSLNSLFDQRRCLPIAALGKTLAAKPEFAVVGSFNPVKSRTLLPFSLRQRCRFIAMNYLPADQEARLIREASGVSKREAKRLVEIAQVVRASAEGSSHEGVSSRALVLAAHLLKTEGKRKLETIIDEVVLNPLSDDPDQIKALKQALVLSDLLGNNLPSRTSKDHFPFLEELRLVDVEDAAWGEHR